jgi:hypothetical protein
MSQSSKIFLIQLNVCFLPWFCLHDDLSISPAWQRTEWIILVIITPEHHRGFGFLLLHLLGVLETLD